MCYRNNGCSELTMRFDQCKPGVDTTNGRSQLRSIETGQAVA